MTIGTINPFQKCPKGYECPKRTGYTEYNEEDKEKSPQPCREGSYNGKEGELCKSCSSRFFCK